MTTYDIISRIYNEVDRTDLNRNSILQFINNRLLQIENFDNYSFMEATATTSTVAAQQSYTLPTDYKDELQMWLLESSHVKTPLVKWVGSEAEKNYTLNNFSTKPFAYWTWQGAFYIYPIPDGVYTLSLKYYKYVVGFTDTALEENELCSRYPSLIINGGVSDSFHYFHQADKEQEWENKWLMEFQKLQRREGKRLFTNYDARMKIRFK